MKRTHQHEEIRLTNGALRIVAVADTHGNPHPKTAERIREAAPQWILHAGDVGDRAVLRALEALAPVIAVRGNIDGRAPDLPDVVTIDVKDERSTLIKILLVHIAVYGTKLRKDVASLARKSDATLVVCGHSHVPFATNDDTIAVFNPGSIGPRRFQLPICLGVIDVSANGVSVRHIDCETGLPWSPKVS